MPTCTPLPKLKECPLNRLEEIVTTAEAKYIRILDFVEEAVSALGEETHKEIHDNYTRKVHTLTDFFAFEFKTDGDFSMYGGRAVHIKHNGSEVLKIEYWKREEFKIRKIIPGDWIDTLESYIPEKDCLFEHYRSEQQDQISVSAIEHNAAINKRSELLETAERLQIVG